MDFELKNKFQGHLDIPIENAVFGGVHHLPSPFLPIFTAIFCARCGCSNFRLESCCWCCCYPKLADYPQLVDHPRLAEYFQWTKGCYLNFQKTSPLTHVVELAHLPTNLFQVFLPQKNPANDSKEIRLA